jgi:hypothetical protein
MAAEIGRSATVERPRETRTTSGATTAFPARAAYDAKKSFAESVDRLAGCDALVRALEGTRTWMPSA